MDNSSRITMEHQINKSANGNSMPFIVAQTKKSYDDFVNQIDKSDFCNSSRRYVIELNYIKQVKDVAQEHNVQELIEQMNTRENEIRKKLKNEFGITIE